MKQLKIQKSIKKPLKVVIILIAIAMTLIVIWFSLDKTIKCNLIYGKNICNFYTMIGSSDFDEMINLCKDMTNVPKKDSCFEFVAQTFAQMNMTKAKEACDYIKGFDNVHSKESCYELIEK